MDNSSSVHLTDDNHLGFGHFNLLCPHSFAVSSKFHLLPALNMLIYRTIITRGPLCAAGCSLSGGQLGRFLSAASDGALASADAAAAGPTVIPVTSSAPSADLEGGFNSTFRRRPPFLGVRLYSSRTLACPQATAFQCIGEASPDPRLQRSCGERAKSPELFSVRCECGPCPCDAVLSW